MTAQTTFDPARHLTLVSGKEYLEVKWRLVWLRSEHPDALIETELVSHHNNEAVFRAHVKLPGGGSATGWGSEDSQGFVASACWRSFSAAAILSFSRRADEAKKYRSI